MFDIAKRFPSTLARYTSLECGIHDFSGMIIDNYGQLSITFKKLSVQCMRKLNITKMLASCLFRICCTENG